MPFWTAFFVALIPTAIVAGILYVIYFILIPKFGTSGIRTLTIEHLAENLERAVEEHFTAVEHGSNEDIELARRQLIVARMELISYAKKH